MAEREALLGFSSLLPKEAAKILIAAYEQAIQLPKGSLQRSLVIEKAIAKVKRSYGSYFKEETAICFVKRANKASR